MNIKFNIIFLILILLSIKLVNAGQIVSAVASFSRDSYKPCEAFTVSISITAPALSSIYSVEDKPPTGWSVSNISDSGVFDKINGKVKWLFRDAEQRVLTYSITPSTSSAGSFTFVGTAMFDTSPVPVSGMRTIFPTLTLNISPMSQCFIGSVIKLTALSVGGEFMQYKFMSGSQVLKDFSFNYSFSFTPSYVKTYQFTVIARDLNGTDPNAIITSPPVTLSIKNPLSAVTLSTTPVKTVLLGAPVKLTAVATGGLSLQYKFMYGSLILRDFSDINTYTWTPASLKTYSLSVVARDLSGMNPDFIVTSPVVTISTKNALSAVALTTAPLNTVLFSKPVTLTATPTGGVNPQYKFMYGSIMLRDFGVNNTFIWTPALVKTYSGITVIAKDTEGINPLTEFTSPPVAITTKNTLSSVSLTSLPVNTVLFGKSVTLTATATGGVNILYKFMYGAVTLRDYTSSNSLIWTPTALKTYSNITVVCKDTGGIDSTATITSAAINITTKSALSSVSATVLPSTVKFGSSVTITANANGGVAVQYKFMYGTIVLRDFANSNSFTWVPAAVKTYNNIYVIAKDIGGIDPTILYATPTVSVVVIK